MVDVGAKAETRREATAECFVRMAPGTVRALRDPGLFTLALGGLFYSFAFFVLLAYTPLLLDLSAQALGLIFFAWGVLLAITSVFAAPWLRARFGPMPVALVVLALFAVDLLVVAVAPRPVEVVAVVLAGALLGVNNALFTSLAMEVSTATRSMASAAPFRI